MTDSIPCDAIGRRIICDEEYATVRYVGSVPPTAGLWLGVEWDNPERGKHSGTYEGVQYFKCSHPTGGSFIRPKKADFGVDFISAVNKRYGLHNEVGSGDGNDEELILGNMPVEKVGFEDIKTKQSDLENLGDISVRECRVSHAGLNSDIHQRCPNIYSINLSRNLLSSWSKVADITRQLNKLNSLDLSENKLQILCRPASLADAFTSLTELALTKNGITWTEVLMCAPMWPNLKKLYLSYNAITHLERPVGVLQSLELLDLSYNALSDGNELKYIGCLPRLETLMLLRTGISSICFDDVGQGFKTSLFPALKVLSVARCNVSKWSFINELNKLQRLEHLICTNNPLMDTEKNPETVRQLIIAKIGQLKMLNKSAIVPDERKGAELDYRKLFGEEWLKEGGNADPEKNKPSERFVVEHPRYQFLIEKYGAPEDGELKRQQPIALKNQLLCKCYHQLSRQNRPETYRKETSRVYDHPESQKSDKPSSKNLSYGL
ncbi:tubulin-specific chaperone E isoform X2 [Protopterus annectens]|uniref:tubulin-specific chaperone E isoform X2 n=1 Tax=Protopterus annectens TaxID=7888 RepID=UPI001CFAFFB3|nr:tubulin-specific chaperone E isoform X2 [Protopterus annectens]